MTISEVEKKTGLGREELELYEREGLVVPYREENGYYSYSEGDLQSLLRIRLLSMLGASTEDVKRLDSGKTELIVYLREKSRELASGSAEQTVCRRICDDGERFSTLKAGKYLELLVPDGDAGAFSPTKDGAALPHPVYRFVARCVDLSIIMLAVLAVVAYVLRDGVFELSGFATTAIGFSFFVVMLFCEPALLHALGTTPGKWMMSLRLRRYNGQKLEYMEGFNRTLGVFNRGFGWGIPVYQLVRLAKSFGACADGDVMPWDDRQWFCYELTDRGAFRIVAGIVICLLCYFATVVLLLLAASRPFA